MFFDLSQSRLLEYLPKVIWPSLLATLKMLLISAGCGLIIGMLFALTLVLTRPNGLMPNRILYRILNTVVDAVRSFPALILIVALAPFTRMVVGTSIGWLAASVALTIIAIPMITRLMESALLEVKPSVILAAQSFGASRTQIIVRVMLIEALPAIVNNLTFIFIQLLANTTLAGAVGAGGLGAVAITFGYERFDDAIMYAIVFILAIWVWTIQGCGHVIYKKLKH